jgi:hypothetical protein
MRVATKAILGAVITFAAASPATSAVIINFNSPDSIPGGNDFTSELGALGLTQIATSGLSLVLDEDSIISFEVLGSESGFNDTFSAGSISYTEFTSLLNSFASPIALGGEAFSAGDLAGLLTFSSSGGLSASIGDPGLAFLLGAGAVSGDPFTVFYLAFDDQITGPDGDFDDLIIRGTVTPSAVVPEATTWAMALIGFGVAGFAMRRGRRRVLPQAA